MPGTKSKGVYFFDTPIGRCAIGWTEKGVDFTQLPAVDDSALEALVQKKLPDREVVATPPPHIKQAVRKIVAHYKGKHDSLMDIKLDLSGTSPFSRKVYQKLRSVKPGKVVTYGELAKKLGSPGASRGVGAAMGANPIPMIIPCHRVVTADRKLGGFSAPMGVVTKAQMLMTEGVMLDPEIKKGMDYLSRRDPKMKKMIKRFPPFVGDGLAKMTPYQSIVNAIIYQQISGKAGSAIAAKFKNMYGKNGNYPEPKVISKLSKEELRLAGISAQKASYLHDLSDKVLTGQVKFSGISRLSDEGIIESLTRIKGIGVWSAQMFLIFHLGRLDVLPVDDLGLQNGAQVAYGLKSRPNKIELGKLGERWRPYRSIATWYLWRAAGAGGI